MTAAAGRLLVVSWEMPPLSGPRAVQVTRTLLTLADGGWEADVVCFGPRSDRYQQDYPVAIESLSQGAVRRVPVASPEEWFVFRALWRVCPPIKRLPDEKRVWVGRATRAALQAHAQRPADVIVSFAQPWSSHLVGRRLHERTGLPWVAHFSDPWVDSPYERGPAWQTRRRAAMEHAVIAHATRVVFVNTYVADRVMAKYPPAWRERVRVVPQGFAPPPAGAGDPPSDGPLRVVYTGRFYDGLRSPDTFLRALASLQQTRALAGRLKVEFVGGGEARYARLADRLGLRDVVVFTGRRAPDEARRAAAAAHLLLLIDAPSDGASLFLPSKLVDYLPLGRPILGLTPAEGPSADLLRSLGYPVVDPGDEAGVTAAIAGALDRHAAGALGPSPRHQAVAAPYDIRETTRAFARILDEARRA